MIECSESHDDVLKIEHESSIDEMWDTEIWSTAFVLADGGIDVQCSKIIDANNVLGDDIAHDHDCQSPYNSTKIKGHKNI